MPAKSKDSAPSSDDGAPAAAESDSEALSVWLFPDEVPRLFGKSKAWLAENAEAGKIRTNEIRGVVRYHRDDVRALVDDDRIQKQAASAVREAVELATTARTGMQKMLDTLLENNARLFEVQQSALDRSREYNKQLEEANKSLREAAERSLTDEHTRQMMTRDVEHKHKLQDKAADGFGKWAWPLLMSRIGKKLGIEVQAPPASSSEAQPPSPGPRPAPDPQEAMKIQLADGFLGWISTLNDETLEKLKAVLSAEHFTMLLTVYRMVKSP